MSSTGRECGGGSRPEKRKHDSSLNCLKTKGARAQMRAASNRRIRSGDGRAVELGRRLAGHANGDLLGASGDRLHRLCDARQIGWQSSHAHRRAARARFALAVVMMLSGCILRSDRVMIMAMILGTIMRRIVGMHVAHLMMHRHKT